jgi:hypothetical protein
MISDLGDYEGTRVLACRLRVAASAAFRATRDAAVAGTLVTAGRQ